MKKPFHVLILAAMTSQLAVASEYYVAVLGNDANPGTLAQPFATLSRAQQAARKAAGREAVTVFIREGTYEGGWQNNRQMGMHPKQRYVENIREELDAPGEWFLDAKSKILGAYRWLVWAVFPVTDEYAENTAFQELQVIPAAGN